MKRTIVVLLSVVMLITLAACQEVQDPKKAENGVPVEYATPGTIGTEFEGVNIEVVGIEIVDGKTTLKTKWVNDTSHKVVYGNSYNISRSENGVWMGCEVRDNLAFEEIAYELSAKASNSKTYDLTGYFDISAPGTYRITSNFRIYENGTDGDGAPYSLWAEFTVLDPEETGIEDGVELDFEVQYIRTNGEHNGIEHFVIRSADELHAYYEQNKDKHNLERKENLLSDETIGFLDACDDYDEKFFEENALILVLLEEGSGSIRHKVSGVSVSKPEMSLISMKINIESIVPEVGTDDMAGWHILIAVDKEEAGANLDNIWVYYNGKSANLNDENSTGSGDGYCGNTETTVHFQSGKSYTFMGSESVSLTDILRNLEYKSGAMCDCLPEYKVDTEFGSGYGINLSEGYARYGGGQAELTDSQLETVREIIEWANNNVE